MEKFQTDTDNTQVFAPPQDVTYPLLVFSKKSLLAINAPSSLCNYGVDNIFVEEYFVNAKYFGTKFRALEYRVVLT